MASGVGSPEIQSQLKPLREALDAAGINFGDSHPANAGFVRGVPKVIDFGAVSPWEATQGVKYAPTTMLAQPGRTTNALLDFLGANQDVQGVLAGKGPLTYARDFGQAGGIGGATLGVTRPLLSDLLQ
jgi:hypothetical protein